MATIEATGHHIIVLKQARQKETEGGIILPDTVDVADKTKLVRGVVVAVGELVSKRIIEGKWVYYPFYAGNAWELGKKVYVTIKDDKVLAVEGV